MFTTADLSKGYYYIELGEASSFLPIFNIPFGRFRFIKMPFGLTVAGDACHHKLDTVFSSLNSSGIADGIIIWGEQSDSSDHDKHLTEFLQVKRKHNLKLNISELQCKNKHIS